MPTLKSKFTPLRMLIMYVGCRVQTCIMFVLTKKTGAEEVSWAHVL